MSELKIKYLLECQICGEGNNHWENEIEKIISVAPCSSCVAELSLKTIQNLLPRFLRIADKLAQSDDFEVLDLCEKVEKADLIEELDDIFDDLSNEYFSKGGQS